MYTVPVQPYKTYRASSRAQLALRRRSFRRRKGGGPGTAGSSPSSDTSPVKDFNKRVYNGFTRVTYVIMSPCVMSYGHTREEGGGGRGGEDQGRGR
jgi:hypothetical protein